MKNEKPPIAQATGHTGSDEQVEQMVGRLLQLGVLLAAVVVIIGAFLLLASHGMEAANFRKFSGEPNGLKSVGSIIRTAFAGESRSIVQLGLVLLIATPVARVAITLGAFVYQRDRLYIGVTTLVLALLLYSLFWGTG